MKKFLSIVLALVVLLSLAVVPAQAEEAEHVEFLLNWTISADHAPYYVALDKGWYQEAGLDVNVVIGQGSGYSAQAIDAGKADIAISDAPVVFGLREDGAEIKIIGIVFDNHPNSMYFWDESGIKEPKDLVGKTVCVPETDGHKIMWPAFAAMIGVDPASVEFINIESTAKVASLASHNCDCVFELRTGAPNFEAAIPEGGYSNILWADYGFECYAHSYITSDSYAAENPETLKKFLDVTCRAWEYTLNNPEEAIEILSKYQPINAEALLKSLYIEFDFLKTDRFKTSGVCSINADKMQATYDLVNTYQKELSFDVTDIFDASFLPETPYNNFD